MNVVENYRPERSDHPRTFNLLNVTENQLRQIYVDVTSRMIGTAGLEQMHREEILKTLQSALY
jgi:hypothetical protein